MPYTYLPEENVIFISCQGELTLPDIADYCSRIQEDPSIPNGAAEFVDLSGITHFNLEPAEIGNMPNLYSPARARKSISATIHLGASEINAGLTKFIEAYFRKHIPDHPIHTVQTYNQALQVLREIREEREN